MLLNEIFNTVAPITWNQTDSQNRGTFVLNNVTYIIKVDEWQFKLPTDTENFLLVELLDVGFSAGPSEKMQSLDPTTLYAGPSVLGAFINGIKPKIQQLQPTAILFGAQKSDPLIDSRMSVYERIAGMYMKSTYSTKLYLETTHGRFILMSRVKFSDSQVEFINEFIASNFNGK